jgi:uncharacterized protein
MMKKTGILLLFALSVFSMPAQDGCMPALPDEKTQDNKQVFDFAQLIPDAQEQALNNKLVQFYRETSNQIVVIITDELCGYEAWEFATRLGEAWGVGRADEDNGVVLVLQPKRDGQKGQVHIATGLGLEGAIPDVYANRITDDAMIPFFKKNDYVGGLNEGTGLIMDLAKGEYNEKVAQIQGSSEEMPPEFMFFVLIILIVFGISIYSYQSRVKKYAVVNKLAYWTAFWILMNQHGHSGRFDGQGRGNGGLGSGGFGGGFGTGGFGGFGGGGFGGGGAGGSW